MPDVNEAHVRDRAYWLWEADGRPEGRAEEYWQRALAEMIEAHAPALLWPEPVEVTRPPADKPTRIRSEATRARRLSRWVEPAQKKR